MSKDTIYREDAIKTVISKPAWHGSDGSYYHGDDIRDALKGLPSADRPQEWIPCSDRLPKDEGIFLVTMETYVFDEYSHPVGTSFYSPSFGWANASPNKVLAWMPLPKPWKGANDE